MAGIPPTTPAKIHFPLHLLKSESVPPALNHSPFGSTIDWLPNFTGYSWIAYGASSLLVISHLPSQISCQETPIGPIFKQVFELGSGDVSSVSWSPADPSEGDLAVAAGNRIFLFKHGLSKGSFCWSQTASLVQSFNVEAIKWTGSGDGIVAGGVEVVLWKRGAKCWEIAWKFEMKQSQDLVSTTFSIQGFTASAPYASEIHLQGSTSANCEKHSVNVHLLDGKSGYIISELRHPQPILMIQWRPLKATHLLRGTSYSTRNVLATSCMDGTVRLWSEVDDGRSRKSSKEIGNLKAKTTRFFVVATVEISQTLNGTLGVDIVVNWATELAGIARMREKTKFFSVQENHLDKVAHCEWLVAVGPGTLVTFWAVHCLDDIKPFRSPRLSLWMSERFAGPSVRYPSDSVCLTSAERSYFSKVSIFRDHLYAPPSCCSLVHLFPCNTLSFSLLSTGKLAHVEDGLLKKYEAEKSLLFDYGGSLDISGHSGVILQVAVHPCSYEAELIVSLDSNGLLIFWSFSLSSMTLSGLPTLDSSWNILGKAHLPDISIKCTSLTWARSWLNEYKILLSGHIQGIDCFIVKISERKEEEILFHKLCTIPFPEGDLTVGPDKLYSVPIRSNCQSVSDFSHSLIIGIWSRYFQALSWTITLHSSDSNECCCDCIIDPVKHPGSHRIIFRRNFAGINYTISVKLCSQLLPDFNAQNEVTSSAVVCPSVLTLPGWRSQELTSDFLANFVTYNIATGHADGTVRLWRSNLSESAVSEISWNLVGLFSVNQGPVTAISVSDAGQRIAIISSAEHSDHAAELSLWEPVTIQDAGSFVLQDVIFLSSQSVALSWCTIGNGQSVLGVQFGNEFHVYAQRRFHSSSTVLNMVDAADASIWFCIAVAHSSAPVSKFLWGSRVTVIAVHEKHFSLYGPFSMIVNEKHLANSCFTEDGFLYVTGEGDKNLSSALMNDSGFHTFKDLSLEETGQNSIHGECNQISGNQFVEAAYCKLESPAASSSFSIIEAMESWFGPLPFYHPEVLLMNIYTGKCQRAYTALKFLVEWLATWPGALQKNSNGDPHNIIGQISLSDYFQGVSNNAGDIRGFGWTCSANLLSSPSNLKGKFVPYQEDSVSALGDAFTADVRGSEFSGFLEALNKPQVLLDVTDADRFQTSAIIDLLKEICDSQSSSAYQSFDEPGRRYWCALRVQQLDIFQRVGRMPTSAELNVNSRLMAWAFHSDCQENLLNAVLSAEPSWEEMRHLGIGFWFLNATQLRTKMEKLARCQYLKNKDPKSCALLYIALGRLQVLAGLFKISKDEKDKPLVGFLSRNFKEEKHKSAALKNAYVLMSRHQLQLAIGFFLLGGDTISAVTVCAKTLGDEQLALVISRLVEGQSGPSEHHLTSKFLLPSAIEKGDFWLASLFEWSLGNYCRSFLTMLGVDGDSGERRSAYLFRHAALVDPSVGQYCQQLAVKPCFRNAIGEQNTSVLLRWATVIYAAALNKCGLPLEALECLAFPSSNPGVMDQKMDSNCEVLPRILFPSPVDPCKWVLAEVALHLENQVKSDLAMQYISNLIREHPGWLSTDATPNDDAVHMDRDMHCSDVLLEGFKKKLNSTLLYLDQKFSLIMPLLLNKVLVLSANKGMSFIGYHILCTIDSCMSLATSSNSAGWQITPYLLKKLMHAICDMTHLLPRFVTFCSMSSLESIINTKEDHSRTHRSGWSCARGYVIGLTLSMCRIKAIMSILLGSSTELMRPAMDILDLSKYCILLAFAKAQNNLEILSLLGHPVVAPSSNVNQFGMDSVREVLCQIPVINCQKKLVRNTKMAHQGIKGETKNILVSEDGEQIIGEACLWMHMLQFLEIQLIRVRDEVGNVGTSSSLIEQISSQPSSLSLQSDKMSVAEHMQKVCMILADSLGNAVLHVSGYYAKQLALYLSKEVFRGISIHTQLRLEEWIKFQSRRCEQISMSTVRDIETQGGQPLPANLFWNMCFKPEYIPQILEQIGFDLSQFSRWKPKTVWSNLQIGIREIEPQADYLKDQCENGFGGSQSEPTAEGQIINGHSFYNFGKQEVSTSSNLLPFKHPREICRRSGDLLEALCISSIDQQQAALAIDRKGIIFFDWNDRWPKPDIADIWSRAEWPQNCWAGTESVPIPTCVSPGIGLGRKKGSHLGLGGATVGVGALSRKNNDATGGEGFGIPGYAGNGASGLGWEVQDDFEQLTDPPAGVGTVSARALSSHPSRDFFLVGSGNTHIYLWEFGKDIATATYGVLPAANVPPPYALASVTSLQFDGFGHRFANAASDGTVCSWQLDVGGRSNVIPTESSQCFNGYASDICYISTSGSIISVTGYSSNGVNVVVWDTLAPPRTCQASVMCHEGGASSIAVFDNDFGSSSVSPLIITGGKGGDVGLHDFRYIATGKMKRQRHHGTVGQMSDLPSDPRPRSNMGDQNRNGMLWYIPNAHSGSITRISTIPNTSMFLTGSKDGDVKLWDAKRANMVYQWPKLHERHTFLQRSSSGFGSVSRVGVTDIRVVEDGFLSCGGDGMVRLVQLGNYASE